MSDTQRELNAERRHPVELLPDAETLYAPHDRRAWPPVVEIAKE